MACSQHHNAGKFRSPELPAGSPRAALLPIAPSAIHQYGARRELKSANRPHDLNLRNEPNVRSYSAEHPWVKVPPQEDIGMPE